MSIDIFRHKYVFFFTKTKRDRVCYLKILKTTRLVIQMNYIAPNEIIKK